MFHRDKLLNATTILSIVIFLVFMLYSYLANLWPYYTFDACALIILTLILYFGYKNWNLNLPVFTMLMLGFVLHLCGVFGWYYKSPISLSWDHITHIVPMFALTCIFFCFATRFMNRKFLTGKNLRVFAIILLAGLGSGVIIELVEFTGFMAFGFGEGGLFFGTGDACPGQGTITSIEQIEEYGVGYFNTMWDLIWNIMGTLLAMIVMIISYFVFGRKEKNLFDEY